MACVSCHKAKVKCVKPTMKNPFEANTTATATTTRCARCSRLNLLCVPHLSQQGKPLAKTSKQQQQQQHAKKRRGGSSMEAPHSNNIDNGATLGTETTLVQNLSIVPSPIYHYGLNYIIRQWMCLAVTRRSFQLQELACRLANKSGISMDQILCGTGLPDAWKHHPHDNEDLSLHRYLVPTICLPAPEQDVGRQPLRQDEIPDKLFVVMRCFRSAPVSDVSATRQEFKGCGGNNTCVTLDIADRWMMVKEYKGGQARFFVTPAFARDIASAETLQQTWVANQTEVKALFLPAGISRDLYNRALLHQIALQHAPRMENMPTRVTGVTLHLSSGQAVTVDLICWCGILSLDRCFIVQEFVPKTNKNKTPPSSTPFRVAEASEQQPESIPQMPLDHLATAAAAVADTMDPDLALNNPNMLFDDLPEYLGVPSDDIDPSIWELLLQEEESGSG